MIANIRKKQVLETIGPSEFAAYLRSHNWTKTDQFGDNATIWTKPSDTEDEFHVLLPSTRAPADYAARIGDAIVTLSQEERRDERQVFHDIMTTNADILRICLLHPSIKSGSIPLEFGLTVLNEARNIMLAAASSTIRARAFFHRRAALESERYVDALRMSQIDGVGFTIALESDVYPALYREFSDQPSNREPEPFPRRATLRLRDGLTTLQQALISSAPTADATPFQDSVAFGVSANLCEALVALSIDGTAEELSFQFNWASTRPVAETTSDSIRFGRDAFPILAEAARILRDEAMEGAQSGAGSIKYPIPSERPVSAVREERTPLTRDDT